MIEIANVKNMSHEEWLINRRVGIGGSDVGAICGLSKWNSAYSIYLRKIGEAPQQEESQQAHFGTVLEEVVAKEFTKATGKKLRRCNKMLRHKVNDFMIANIDRMVVGEKAFLECKTTSAYNFKEWEGDNIPEVYMLQIQHYMEVLDYDYCYIACLIGGNNFIWKKINRDKELVSIIVDIEKKFWNENVMKRIPPAISGGEADSNLMDKLYPNSKEESEVALSYETSQYIDKLLELKKQKKELDLQISHYENLIKNEMQENEIGYIDDYIVDWKSIKSNRVNTKMLNEKYPDIYAECCYESSFRKFTIKAPNKEG